MQEYLFNEHLFNAEMRSFLRRALCYVEESDYRRVYYERLIDNYLSELDEKTSKRKREKILSGVFLATQMIAYYATNCGKYRIGIMVSEYLIIRYWKYLLKHKYLGKGQYVEWLIKYLVQYEKENSEEFHVPTYLLDMKKNFDTAYDEPFSLDDAAQKYQINKFRLCREFAANFQDTPLQYLNHVRIEHAKDLLLNTDEKICDIGQMVGIENTNHFIRLFKEKTGVTPLKFRKETPIIH